MYNKNRLKSVSLILILLSISSLIFVTTNVSADYNVKVGDSFKFTVKKFRNIADEPLTYAINDIILKENAILTINVSTVNPPFEIEYLITSENDGVISDVNEYSLFWQTIFLNRTWDKLTEYYELLSYEVQQNNRIWSARITEGDGEVEAEFLKEDGVLRRIFITNYPPLRSATGIKTVEIERTWSGQNASIPMYIFLPIFILSLIFLAKTKKHKINKVKK
ncbi:MAG: hypothetical protein EAX90_15650 [Candidatus Heimdallarchaeota archaeon]|nr:hypothetical protein [Candidatus Heimdallarchaeota archaeon]